MQLKRGCLSKQSAAIEKNEVHTGLYAILPYFKGKNIISFYSLGNSIEWFCFKKERKSIEADIFAGQTPAQALSLTFSISCFSCLLVQISMDYNSIM